MNQIVAIMAVACMAYLLGAMPFSLALIRFHGLLDPRSYGSGNIGATNVGRQKKSLGVAVFFLDASKVLCALMLARYAGVSERLLPLLWLLVIFGQSRSVFLNWTGGKGVSCFIAGIASLYPHWFFPLAIPSLALLLLTQRVWVASVTAVGLFGIFSVLSVKDLNLWIHLTVSLWILLLHAPNFKQAASYKQLTHHFPNLFNVFSR